MRLCADLRHLLSSDLRILPHSPRRAFQRHAATERGAHRFHFGKPITETIYFFTGGLLMVGWVIDLFLIPGMRRSAEQRYRGGRYDYTRGWILLTFLGLFGVHRFYVGKWVTGLLYLLTGRL